MFIHPKTLAGEELMEKGSVLTQKMLFIDN